MSIMGTAYKGYTKTNDTEWRNAIGKALLNFSAIELMTYVWIEKLCGAAVAKPYFMKWRPIGQRIDDITAAIEKQHKGTPWRDEAVKAWTLVKDEMADHRNEIAHNPTAVVPRSGVEVVELLHIGSYDESTKQFKTTRNPKYVSELGEAFGEMAAELGDLLAKKP